MKTLRMVLVAALLLNAALIVVYLEIASVRLRYETVRMQERVRKLALENRELARQAAEARRPENLGARDTDLRMPRHEDVQRPAMPENMVRAGHR